ncbi:MAG: hypothetical protein M3Q10_13695 [Chloroflexota bacterium]|nr:hypothetical protein [Chloroflexota bacterium]
MVHSSSDRRRSVLVPLGVPDSGTVPRPGAGIDVWGGPPGDLAGWERESALLRKRLAEAEVGRGGRGSGGRRPGAVGRPRVREPWGGAGERRGDVVRAAGGEGDPPFLPWVTLGHDETGLGGDGISLTVGSDAAATPATGAATASRRKSPRGT